MLKMQLAKQTSVNTQMLEPNGIREKHKIRTEELNAWFGKNHVLKDISMMIREYAITAIIGPSGCGKSTLIRCFNRMHELVPSARVSGTVLLDGRNIYDRGVDPVLVRRIVGMVFQKPNPFPTMSVYDNVAAGLKLNGISRRKDLDEVVRQSLEQAGLWDEVKNDLDKSGASLSGGQQQRLCIARTLAVQPQIMLMDEPCSALDPIATAKIEQLMITLKKRYTLVIVTHNMQQAARVSDNTAFLYLGRLVEYSETSRFFENPSDPLTEKYITGKFG